MLSFRKVVGMIAAVLALSGVAASAASGQEFTASKYPTTATDFSSKGNDNLETEAGSVECTVHYALGALSGPAETATLTPTYTECQAFGFSSATVNMNGCDYVLHVGGTFDIECPAGKSIVISASTCEATIGTQTGLNSVALANAGTNITAKLGLSGIAYTVTKDGAGCAFSGTGAKTGATYTQAAALTLVPTNGATIDIGEPLPPTGSFTASKYPTAATATSAKGNDDFKTEGGSVECKVHYAASELTEPSETLTVTPTFSECQAFGFIESTVSTNGCDYVFHANGELDIECPAGKVITIVSATCEATIGTQTGLKAMTLTNSGSGISAKLGLKGIAYTVTKDGFLCPFNGTGAKTGGEYVQNKAIEYSSTNGATIDIGEPLPPAGSFTASKYPTAATATSEKGNDDFKAEGGSMECKVHYAASGLTEQSETLTVTPTFSECQSFGFIEGTVSTNGCDYVFHANGELDIECPAGKVITIVSATCEATIGTQTGLKAMTLTNSGSGISAKLGLKGIAYTVTKDGFLCPFNGTGAKTGAEYIQNKAIQISSTNGATIDIG